MDKSEDQQNAIKLLETKKCDIEQQISRLQTVTKAIRCVVDMLEINTTLDSMPVVSTELKNHKPTIVILGVLGSQPKKAWTVVELAKEMKKWGYILPPKNFLNIISSIASRLAKDRKIDKIKEKGMATQYKIKKTRF